MKNKYTFRGRSMVGIWITGDLLHEGDCVLIKNGLNAAVKVDSDTVGLFTGFYDTAGTPIFEGDILECRNERFALETSRETLSFVGLSDYAYATNRKMRISPEHIIEMIPKSVVVGNMHENPEALTKFVKTTKS